MYALFAVGIFLGVVFVFVLRRNRLATPAGSSPVGTFPDLVWGAFQRWVEMHDDGFARLEVTVVRDSKNRCVLFGRDERQLAVVEFQPQGVRVMAGPGSRSELLRWSVWTGQNAQPEEAVLEILNRVRVFSDPV